MRILLDCEQLKHPYTGLYTYCTEVAEAMARVISEDDKLSFLVPRGDDRVFGDQFKYIKRDFKENEFPYIFVPGLDIWHSTFQLTRYTGGSLGTKKVLTIHDLNCLHEDIALRDRKKLLEITQKNFDRADHIIAISEFVKRDIENNLNIRNKPISVVYNGYKIREYSDFDNPAYRPRNPFIFTMGMVNEKKNFMVLPALLRNNEYELVIAGKLIEKVELEYKERIETQALKYGVQDRIRFLGSIPEEDKYWYMKNCAAFAFPSLAEGFGAPVLEAMHFGKPVFLSTFTSLPEIGGTYAYYFESFDPDYMIDLFNLSMDKFYSDPNRSEEVRRYSTRFSYDKAAREYYRIYKSLL